MRRWLCKEIGARGNKDAQRGLGALCARRSQHGRGWSPAIWVKLILIFWLVDQSCLCVTDAQRLERRKPFSLCGRKNPIDWKFAMILVGLARHASVMGRMERRRSSNRQRAADRI